jgi:hypothetical protein
LRARSPDGWTFASIEHPELNHGEVGSPSHDSSERIDLPDHCALGNATNCRIARHLTDGFQRARDQPDPSSKSSCCNGRFGSGVAGSDNYNVEFSFKVLR